MSEKIVYVKPILRAASYTGNSEAEKIVDGLVKCKCTTRKTPVTSKKKPPRRRPHVRSQHTEAAGETP
jgi:hypothetical protein